MDRGRWKRYALYAFCAVMVLMVFAVLYGWLPWWIDSARLRSLSPKDQAGILGSDRGDVLKMVAGAGALVALVYTERKHRLDRAGQVTDRYAKAIALLASEKESERIGAVYALERIMADSARDHLTVIEVLAAFVRERAPLDRGNTLRMRAKGRSIPGERLRAQVSSSLVPSRPSADVQAAMTVLARRPRRHEPFEIDLRRARLAGLELPADARLAGVNFEEADLTQANLNFADLTGANLQRAKLNRAYLQAADLSRANLTGATLDWARVEDATLTKADLRDASLKGALLLLARLGDTRFDGATLTGAWLRQATLTRANFARATLTGAQELAPVQLADALVLDSTKLDEDLAADDWVIARIKACRRWSEWKTPIPAPTPYPDGTSPEEEEPSPWGTSPDGHGDPPF